MFDKAEKALSTTTIVIQIFGALLVGTIMVFFAGLPLVLGGIGSGWIPLILGVCGFVTAARKTLKLIR